jgi:hypothetical protein
VSSSKPKALFFIKCIWKRKQESRRWRGESMLCGGYKN